MARGREVKRATFEETIKKQKQFREKLYTLIDEERSLEDADEKKRLRELVDRSCLGLETQCDVKITAEGEGASKRPGDNKVKGTFTVYNRPLSSLITLAVNLDEPVIEVQSGGIPQFAETPLEGQVKIEEIWSVILKKLENVVWPAARQMALRVSPEREEKYGKTKSSPRD